MFDAAIQGLTAILGHHSWVAELAGILPLSVLIDFIDIPIKLHILQLSGAVPLWSWQITPFGSRLLLSNSNTGSNAHLDRFGNSLALTALDGRYGDMYLVSSPETLRICCDSQEIRVLENLHENMKGKNLRIQTLEVVHVTRLPSKVHRESSNSWFGRLLLDPWWMFSFRYLAISALGWSMWVGMVVMSGILDCRLALVFLLLIPLTGYLVFLIHGMKSMHLLVSDKSSFNRLVLVAEHMNTTHWIAFYGESTIVNSFLNRPLEPIGPNISPTMSRLFRMVLRFCILGQWALSLGAAATKNFNAYFITFWAALSIIMHAYLIPPSSAAKDWLKSKASIRLQRYQTRLSSRRALLNTIIALNPDTFALSKITERDDRTKFHEGAMKWIDRILEQGPSRTRWENATREAMDAAARYTSDELISAAWQGTHGGVVDSVWDRTYQEKGDYWRKFIFEGIYMAEKIKRGAGLSGRKVDASSG